MAQQDKEIADLKDLIEQVMAGGEPPADEEEATAEQDRKKPRLSQFERLAPTTTPWRRQQAQAGAAAARGAPMSWNICLSMCM